MTISGLNYKFSPDVAENSEQTAAQRIRTFIADNHLTQKEFAARLNVSIGAVAQWLSGKRKVSGPVLAYLDLHGRYRFLQSMYDLRADRAMPLNSEGNGS